MMARYEYPLSTPIIVLRYCISPLFLLGRHGRDAVSRALVFSWAEKWPRKLLTSLEFQARRSHMLELLLPHYAINQQSKAPPRFLLPGKQLTQQNF
jgi:hypothetical protein